MDLATFASAARPLRPSRLPRMMACPLSEVLSQMIQEGEAGPAADTGSAVHAAVAAWHKGKDTLRAIKGMREGIEAYPFADLDTAEQHFRSYAADPRNQTAKVLLVEEPVRIVLPPSKDDPTKEEVVIEGTCDQVREDGGTLALWDLKTGAPEGPDMLDAHCIQFCAYMIGATVRLKRNVTRAGVIRTRDYLKKDKSRKNAKPGPVFWEAPWNLNDAKLILGGVPRIVAAVRRRELSPVPGSHCRFCVGISTCTREVRGLCSIS